jgi:branched-chain amino acid aminotransferase
MRAILQDGLLRPDGTVALDADDPGLILGLAAFETLRTAGRRPWRPWRHLARLEQSAAALAGPWPGAELLHGEILAVIAALPGVECNVRITLTRGGARILRALPLSLATGAARVGTAPWEPPPWLPGAVKHVSRAGGELLVRARGLDEILWVDRQDHLLEGTRSNVIAVRGGRLHTPPTDGRILSGVTREALLEVARDLGLPVDEAPLRRDAPSDELYLCSTLRELQALVELDGAPTAGEGPVGRALHAGFRALLTRENLQAS